METFAIIIIVLILCIIIISFLIHIDHEGRERRLNAKNKFLETFKANNYKEALNYAQDFSDNTSFDKDIEEKLAYCYLQIGRYKEAINIYEKLIKLPINCDNYKLHFNIALVKGMAAGRYSMP